MFNATKQVNWHVLTPDVVLITPDDDVLGSGSSANPMFEEVEQPGIGSVLMPGSPLVFSNAERRSGSTPTRCSRGRSG